MRNDIYSLELQLLEPEVDEYAVLRERELEEAAAARHRSQLLSDVSTPLDQLANEWIELLQNSRGLERG